MIIFRVDFDAKIGLGHLKRTLVYAKQFNEVIYVSKSDQKELIPYPLKTVQNEEEFFDIVKRLQPKQVIIDNYNFTLKNQKRFKAIFPDIKLSIYDDEYKEYCCDEILNVAPFANKKKYKNPKIVKIINPPIREEFYKVKKLRIKKDGIFVSFGGTDANNLTLKVLKLLKKKKINLYITSLNQNLKKIKRYAFIHKNIKLHIDKDVAIGMAKSKFAIITPSTIAYEAMFMDLPFIAIQTAQNQKEFVKYMKKYRIRVIQNAKKIANYI